VENDLRQELESPSSPEAPSYTCCVHTRDFLPGLPIMDQIISSMKASRGAIIVVSSSYCQQAWTRLEWRQALSQSSEDRTKRLIVLLHGVVSKHHVEDRDLWNYVVNKKYIDTNDNNLWVKLRASLPSKDIGAKYKPSNESHSVVEESKLMSNLS